MSEEKRAGEAERAREALAKIGGERAERHIMLCALSEKQKCCSPEQGARSWAYLKRRMKELGLVDPQRDGGAVLRTKADCLQVCADGPIAVVWPDNFWYRGCTSHVLEEIIQQHLLGGQPVEAHRLYAAPSA